MRLARVCAIPDGTGLRVRRSPGAGEIGLGGPIVALKDRGVGVGVRATPAEARPVNRDQARTAARASC